MTPAQLSEALRAALVHAVDDGTFALDPAAIPATVHLERPRQREHGDWATNVAMQLALPRSLQVHGRGDRGRVEGERAVVDGVHESGPEGLGELGGSHPSRVGERRRRPDARPGPAPVRRAPLVGCTTRRADQPKRWRGGIRRC